MLVTVEHLVKVSGIVREDRSDFYSLSLDLHMHLIGSQVTASCHMLYSPSFKTFKEALDDRYSELQVQEIVPEDGKLWLVVHRYVRIQQ